MSRLAPILAPLLGLVVAGCTSDVPGYLMRAGYEEARILWRRQPIEKLLDGDLDPEMRRKLELTLDVRRFAKDALGLDVGGSYKSISEVDADQIVHVVSAAPRNRLEAYTWWFPIVGRVPYRGYFAIEDARNLVDDLERRGYDTYLRPSVAFSTLGWFDDPLLTNLLRHDDVRLTEIILHELLHNTIYISGQAAFNESLASFVGHRGAIEFFAQRGDRAYADQANDRWSDTVQFSSFLAEVMARLDAAYDGGVSEEQRQQLFDQIRTGFSQRKWLSGHYENFATAPLNNAILVQKRVYAGRLDLFEQCFERYRGDLRRTIHWLAAQADSGGDAYSAVAAGLAMPTSAARQ
jgi:predicted aminopeptidase